MKRRKEGLDLTKYKSANRYRESYKQMLLDELMLGELTMSEVASKHAVKIPFLSRLKKEYVNSDEYFRILDEMKKKRESEYSGDLARENEELKKALQQAQMKVVALETLIDVAEDQLNVDIRKKPGSKQSK